MRVLEENKWLVLGPKLRDEHLEREALAATTNLHIVQFHSLTHLYQLVKLFGSALAGLGRCRKPYNAEVELGVGLTI